MKYYNKICTYCQDLIKTFLLGWSFIRTFNKFARELRRNTEYKRIQNIWICLSAFNTRCRILPNKYDEKVYIDLLTDVNLLLSKFLLIGIMHKPASDFSLQTTVLVLFVKYAQMQNTQSNNYTG